MIVGGVAALVAFFFGNYLLPVNQQQALLALRMLAPTIFFSAILGVMRGYFQAHSTMTVSYTHLICVIICSIAFEICVPSACDRVFP